MAKGPDKTRAAYVCNACGAAQPKWSGQCPDCGAWNTLEEMARPPQGQSRAGDRGGYAGAAGHPESEVQTLADIQPEERLRIGTGIGELDRVLGGGLVIGSVVLLGGDPGIGKSTLLLQACESPGGRAARCSMSAARSPPSRSGCAPGGWDSPGPASGCWPRPAWSASWPRPSASGRG